MAFSRKVEVLLHEIMHLFLVRLDKMDEEVACIRAGEGYAALLVDNREFFEDLLDCFEEDEV